MTLARILVNNVEANLLSAHVTRNGDNAIDTGEFKLSPHSVIADNDIITYVQDVVDLTFLTSIYNFHYSARDEAGYDIDGDDGTYTADFLEDGTRDFTKSIEPVIRFNANDEKVTIADHTRIDFSKQFDIIIVCTVASFPTDAMTLYSKSNVGVNGGIEISVTSGDPGYVEVELYDTAGVLTTITGTNVDLRDNDYHFIRVKRDETGLVTVSTDNVTEGTPIVKNAVADNYTATGVNAFIGKNAGAGTKHYNGNMAQLRIYCGGYLNDSNYSTLLSAKRQPLTMKFRGKVSKLKNDKGVKEVFAKGINEQLNTIKISKDNMDARNEDANNNGIDNIFLDDATNRMRTDTIIQQIFATIDPEYIFANATNPGTIMNRYVARETIIAIMTQLFTLDNREFWITPRKVVIKENQPITSKYSFLDSNYNINVSEKDDNEVVNDIEGVGEVQIHNKIEQFSGTGSQTAFSLAEVPITTKTDVSSVVKVRGYDSGDTAGNDYYIEYTDGVFSGAQLIFFTAPASGTNNITIEYTYENTNTLIFRTNDATSISNHGRISGRVFLPGFAQNQLATYLNILIDKTKNVNERIAVVAPRLANFVREGLEADVVVDAKNIDALFTIKSIQWFYPENSTIINFGEHELDYYDIIKITNDKVSELSTASIKSNNL